LSVSRREEKNAFKKRRREEMKFVHDEGIQSLAEVAACCLVARIKDEKECGE
jgi:hypothetical protein